MNTQKQKKTGLGVFVLSLGTVLFLHLLFALITQKFPWSENFYHSYALQADAWTRGQLDLGQDYPWLELAIYQGKYFVSFPPFPSYLLFPLALILGADAPDGFLALAFLLLGCACAVGIARHFHLPPWAQALLPVFLYCGTNLWQITVDAWVWFLAQNLACSLTLAAFLAALKGKRGLCMLALCAAVGCRPFQLFYLPVCLYILYEQRTEQSRAKRWAGLLLHRWFVYLPAFFLACSYLALNYFRFGSVFEFGHNYLPEFTRSQEGQFSLRYVQDNFGNLLRLIVPDGVGGYEIPTFNGINIFLVFPLLLYGMYGLFQSRHTENKTRRILENAGMAFLCGLHILFFLCHKTLGGSHFGNRYFCDLMPAVLLILARNLSLGQRKKFLSPFSLGALLCAFLFLWGLAFNGWGVVNYYLSLG